VPRPVGPALLSAGPPPPPLGRRQCPGRLGLFARLGRLRPGWADAGAQAGSHLNPAWARSSTQAGTCFTRLGRLMPIPIKPGTPLPRQTLEFNPGRAKPGFPHPKPGFTPSGRVSSPPGHFPQPVLTMLLQVASSSSIVTICRSWDAPCSDRHTLHQPTLLDATYPQERIGTMIKPTTTR
jgi:hypothetical protein